MSTKTLRKRIALVAVAALGAGLLSVVAVPSANAATTAIDNATYTANGASDTGVCSAIANTGTNSTQVGEILSTGSFVLTGNDDAFDAAGDFITVTLSGPARFIGVTQDATAANRATVTYPSATVLKSTAGSTPAFEIPDSITIGATGVGTIQVTIASNDGGVAVTEEIYTITSSATCLTQAFSATNSLMRVSYYANRASAANNTTDADAADTTTNAQKLAISADRVANGGTGWIAVTVKDGSAAKTTLTANGIFGATATNGAVISWSNDSSLQSSSAFVETAGSASLSVFQGDANEDKPMSTVVTVTYNGAVVGSRTINFTGKPTAIAVNAALSGTGKKSAASAIIGTYEITDAAGNKLTSEGEGVVGDGAAANAAVLADVTKKLADSVSQTVVANSDYTVYAMSTGYAGKFNWTCGTSSGSAKIYLTYTFSDLSKLTSPAYDARCGDAVVNYKASLDKASYVPGEIATLTISATDSKGQLPYDVDAAGAGNDLGASGASAVAISLPALTAVTAPTNTDEFVTGKKTYKFTVGTTEGSFSGVVDLPLYNGTTYAQTAQTVSYKVAGTAGVTNADVLKAIVSLIASINKQIAALQKALLKR
jgi:hypothetical protein